MVYRDSAHDHRQQIVDLWQRLVILGEGVERILEDLLDSLGLFGRV